MAIYLGNKEVSITTQYTITEENINEYKFQDIAEITQKGGKLATDEEYFEAELKLQPIYATIMLGGEENE